MKNKNKDFKVKKWEFVFPDETPLGICSEFAEVFINSTMERDPNFAGIIVGYPVSLYGEICLRDAGKKVLGLFDVYLCGEPVEVAMVDIDIAVGFY